MDEFFTLAIGGMRASALEQRAPLPIRVSAHTPTPTHTEKHQLFACRCTLLNNSGTSIFPGDMLEW